MIVCKFGGSSLSDAAQIRKACAILLENSERKIMVVSAPGKRRGIQGDTKFTDVLIFAAEEIFAGRGGAEELRVISTRLRETARDLCLPSSLAAALISEINLLAGELASKRARTRDALLAMGEISAARMVAAFLQKEGCNARFVDPREAGLLLARADGTTCILPETYDRLASLAHTDGIVVFPGFFGVSREGEIITFSRGGSDITGAVLAAAVNADLYENWTDRDSVFAADPELVRDAVPLAEMSFREMRVLSSHGFSIFHPDALEPVIQRGIPVHIRNTNNPSSEGTRLVAERTDIHREITGIAAADHYSSVRIQGLPTGGEQDDRSLVFSILADLGIRARVAHSGNDALCFIIRDPAFTQVIESDLRQQLRDIFGMAGILVNRELTALLLAGEGLSDTGAVLARAMAALEKEQIIVDMSVPRFSEISMLFLIHSGDKKKAVRALYREFFE